ncbi:MAG: ferredoxin family protein [Methanomethylovorans sp.]|jgi:NAD-dependent dihydropyrimidine dehydrogenase PreA subunit|nr:ferredoxin family protein [Methanomethylovorans sp.]
MPAKVNPNICEGIGSCKEACPEDVFELKDDEKGNIKSVVKNPDNCIECGLCVDACPMGAITIE